jgi:hypothetical protein
MKRLLLVASLLLSATVQAQIANVQNRLEDTDDWTSNTTMVNTLAGAVTTNNGVTCICVPDRNRECNAVSGAATYSEVVSEFAATPNSGLSIFSAVATATTAAQTATATGTTDAGGDFLWCQEFSGIASPLNISGTQGFGNATVATTSHLSGASVTPDTANTICYMAGGFCGSTGTVTHGGGSWNVIATSDNTRYIAYMIQNGSTSAIDMSITTGNSRTSLLVYGCIAGSVSGASNAPRAMHYKRLMGFNLDAANDDEYLLRAGM